jgi:hypothetical protein
MDSVTYANLFFVVVNTALCINCFKEDKKLLGWLNLLASSLNCALVAAKVL